MIQQDEATRQILACICHPLPTVDLRLLQFRSLTKGVVIIKNIHWNQAQFARDGVQNTPQPLALTLVVADNRCFDS